MSFQSYLGVVERLPMYGNHCYNVKVGLSHQNEVIIILTNIFIILVKIFGSQETAIVFVFFIPKKYFTFLAGQRSKFLDTWSKSSWSVSV